MKRLRELYDAGHSLSVRAERRFAAVSSAHGARATRLAFAFVFVTFGAQKVVFPEGSPVDGTILTFAAAIWVLPYVPIEWAPPMVGLYEILLGALLARNRLFAAACLFVPHQLTGFLSFLITPDLAFGDPAPFAFEVFGAFVWKNVVFVAAFLLLYAHRDDA